MNSLFDKLKQEESSILGQDFVSVSFRGCPITVSVSNIILSLIANKQGWGVFRVNNYKKAQFVREPELHEKLFFLERLPRINLVVCFIRENIFYGTDGVNVYPIWFPDNIQLFDHIVCRVSGKHIIYDSPNYNSDPTKAEALRTCFNGLNSPKECSTVDSYAFKLATINNKDAAEKKLELYISRGGGHYISHVKRNDDYVITYEVVDSSGSKHTHTSTVDKNLQVQSAGFCLDGTDNKHDLQSLMLVLKEGYDRNLIHRW